MDTDLIEPTDQEEYFVEFLVDGYLRGDAKARAEALAIRWQHGNINADQWRESENENPLPDGLGQMYFTPVNYAPVNPVDNYHPATAPATVRETVAPPPPGSPNAAVAPDQLTAIPTHSLAQFDCPECGKLINRLASAGTVGYCRGCKSERTMAVAS
jgi:hypothetical protein